jgi:transcriptional regulator with XRE-family HTH domain
MYLHRIQPPPDFWHRPDVVTALERRDMGAFLRRYRGITGASQADVGLLVGLAQSHVSVLERGRRKVTSLELFERFADGLGIPRSLIGLDEPVARVRASGSEPEGGDPWVRASGSEPEGGDPWVPEGGDVNWESHDVVDVGRRAVLRTIGLAATGAGLAADELMALLRTPGPRTADPRAVEAFGEVLHRAASLGPPVKPAHIQSTVHAVLERLVQAQEHPAPLELRRRIAQLASDAACFVGWLHYDRGQIAGARAYFSLAADAARDADDATRFALVQASQGTSYSPSIDGGPGDAGRALELLAAADRLLAAQAPHRAAAWINANAAARAAHLGDRRLFAVHRDRATDLQGHEAEPMSGLWHWFPPRSAEPDWLDDYLCGGLVLLADPAAESTLRGIVARSKHGHRVADAYKLLMELHVAEGDHDAAAAAGIRALRAARAAGLERQDERIRGLRARAPHDVPAYAELDAALGA